MGTKKLVAMVLVVVLLAQLMAGVGRAQVVAGSAYLGCYSNYGAQVQLSVRAGAYVANAVARFYFYASYGAGEVDVPMGNISGGLYGGGSSAYATPNPRLAYYQVTVTANYVSPSGGSWVSVAGCY